MQLIRIENQKSGANALSSNVKFYPFESQENLGHYDIHKAKNFETIMEEITFKSLSFSSKQKSLNFDAPVDVHGLNNHVFGFFSAMHLTYAEKLDDKISIQVDGKKKEGQSFLDYENRLNGLTSYKDELEQNVSEFTSTITRSISSTTNSISKSMTSAFKFNQITKLM